MGLGFFISLFYIYFFMSNLILGCIIYKMFVGKTPFIDQTEYLIFQKIKKGQFSTNSLVKIDIF